MKAEPLTRLRFGRLAEGVTHLNILTTDPHARQRGRLRGEDPLLVGLALVAELLLAMLGQEDME